jgi:serine/threonine protein kinase
VNGEPGDEPAGQPEARDARASRYEVLTKIATGGMATVYVGRIRGAEGFSRLVAIKRPHAFVSEDASLRAALGREARVASMIHHPHVVSVLDVEDDADGVALVLDYVEGGTLADLLSYANATATPLAPSVAIRVVLDIASGLHAAHVLCDRKGVPVGIVHRDVTPQNILVGLDGQARLTDFGIAKIASAVDHTATDILKGKAGYLPPEYVERRSFDARSDEYALGVVTWEALTGRRLFRDRSEADTLRKILEGRARPLSEVNPALRPLDDVVLRALARDPRARFESVAAFAAALEERAREHAWVAPDVDVAAAVRAAVGSRLMQRRTEVESSAPRLLVDVSAERPRPPSPRDELPTRSLLHPGPADTIVEPPEPETRLIRRSRPQVVLVPIVLIVAAGAIALLTRTPVRPADVASAASPDAAAASMSANPAPADEDDRARVELPDVPSPAAGSATTPGTPVVRPASSAPYGRPPHHRRAPPNPYSR